MLRDGVELLRAVQRTLSGKDGGGGASSGQAETASTTTTTTTTRSGEQVHHAVLELLDEHEKASNQRGKEGQRRKRQRPLIAHIKKVLTSYAPGLFTCYDHPDLPATTNAIESLNGETKHHFRATTGRGSTAGGVAQTQAELVAPAVRCFKQNSVAELQQQLSALPTTRYHAARAEQQAICAPARRYRSIQRNPTRYLAALRRRATQVL